RSVAWPAAQSPSATATQSGLSISWPAPCATRTAARARPAGIERTPVTRLACEIAMDTRFFFIDAGALLRPFPLSLGWLKKSRALVRPRSPHTARPSFGGSGSTPRGGHAGRRFDSTLPSCGAPRGLLRGHVRARRRARGGDGGGSGLRRAAVALP